LIVVLKNKKGDSMLVYLVCLLLVGLAAGLIIYVAYEIYDIYLDLIGGK
jgi:uncharacterized membrane protein